jgi:hypothetical protein
MAGDVVHEGLERVAIQLAFGGMLKLVAERRDRRPEVADGAGIAADRDSVSSARSGAQCERAGLSGHDEPFRRMSAFR